MQIIPDHVKKNNLTQHKLIRLKCVYVCVQMLLLAWQNAEECR